MIDYDDDLISDEDYEEVEYPPDPKTQEVKKLILARMEENPDRIYFQRQLEVIHEKQFFHWVTDRAIAELHGEGDVLIDYYPIQVGEHKDKVKLIRLRKNRYFRTEAKNIARLVEAYSHPAITADNGFLAEELFKVAYGRYGFSLLGENTREFDGRKWTKTAHDIDFIVEKKGKVFGCEVKNMLGYMDKKELDVKTKLCKHLRIMPIFIMRYSPTVWNYEIFENGGLVQIFEKQVYSPGKRALVQEMVDELELPVMVSRAIPESIMDRLEKTLNKRVFRKKR